MFFICGNWSGNDAPTWRHFACCLKNEDMGYCNRLSGVRGSAFLPKERGGKRKYRSWKTEVNIGALLVIKVIAQVSKFYSSIIFLIKNWRCCFDKNQLPTDLAVYTHVHIFHTACKITSCRCVVAWPVSANKTIDTTNVNLIVVICSLIQWGSEYPTFE